MRTLPPSNPAASPERTTAGVAPAARRRSPGALLAAGLGAVAAFAPLHAAQAQSPSVIKPVEPDLLLLLDTSAGMANAMDGTSLRSTSCSASGKKTRWAALAEVLTGKINHLECGMVRAGNTSGGGEPQRWVPLSSNQCVPLVHDHPQILNNTNGLSGNPGRWPLKPGGHDYALHPIIFKDNYGCQDDRCDGRPGANDLCDFGAGEWSQLNDGVVDSFNTLIRFGLATSDGLQISFNADCTAVTDLPARNNWVHEAGTRGSGYTQPYPPRWPGWSLNNWGAVPNPGLQLWRQAHLGLDGLSPKSLEEPYFWRADQHTDVVFPRAYSYWYESAGETWRNGTRDYSDERIAAVCTFVNTADPSYDAALRPDVPFTCVTDTDCNAAPNCSAVPGSCFCSSERNPYNPAQHVCQKRMALITDTADIGIRNTEAPPWMGRLMGFDPTLAETPAQRIEHNEMIQYAVLAAGPYESSAPLAAMLRDTHEFLTVDDVSEGSYLPDEEPVKMSPLADTLYTGANACRESHLILVSQGEPSQDLGELPGHYAAQLLADGTKTFTVGVGLSTIRFDTNANGDPYDDAPTDCSTLTVDDLAVDKACEYKVDGTNPEIRYWRYADETMKDVLTPSERTAVRQCCTLLDTAVAGGTERAYFAANQQELKTALGNLFSLVAGGTLSRTVPVFAPVTSNFVSQNLTSNAPSVFFELRSSMEVPIESSLWVGHLERVRYLCDGDLVPERQEIDDEKGDVFEANLEATSTRKRRFFTAVPEDEDNFDRSMRPHNPTAWCSTCGLDPDNYDGADTDTYTRLGGGANDQLLEIDAFTNAIDAVAGIGIDDVIGVHHGDVNACRDYLGNTIGDDDECARRVLRWFGAHSDPCKGDTCDTKTRLSADSGSPLGAIYRSNPVIVQPPSPDVADQTYANVRSDPSDLTKTSFVAQQATRPTMLYAQSVDGQLHAFSMAKNIFDGVSAYDTGVSDGDTEENNELWTFVPPVVLPSLWSNFNTHARLLDGPLAAANVVYKRNLTELAEGTAQWSTVVVGSGGVSQLGGYYYAIDVTNPLQPRFLWQLSKSRTTRLFGDYAGGAAITHMVIREAGAPKVIAVAILPGGMPKNIPNHHHNRDWDVDGKWNGVDYKPRKKIRDWGNNQASRSLTFVELATGRIITRLHGEDGDTPVDNDVDDDDGRLHPQRVENVDFDSPISGTPAAFPFATGEPARQIYVGDSEGTMWRINVTSTDPDDWEADIAWDPYSRDGTTNGYDSSWVANGANYGQSVTTSEGKPSENAAATAGQPVQMAPLISLDERGVPVIMYSTGDQEGFTSKTPGMVTFVTAFTDEVDSSGDWSPRLNDGPMPGAGTNRGVQIAFVDGARATGPLSLYDGQLILSFFDPNTGVGCATGSGGTCAFRYNERDSGDSPPSPIPFLDFDEDNDVDAADICYTRPDEFVFGVAINQVPSCAGANDTFGDPWLAGSYTAASTSNSSGYQLVMHTGEGGTAEDGGVTNTTRVALPLPRIAARVNSWVSALE